MLAVVVMTADPCNEMTPDEETESPGNYSPKSLASVPAMEKPGHIFIPLPHRLSALPSYSSSFSGVAASPLPNAALM